MLVSEIVSGRKLLVQIHIAQMHLGMCRGVINQANKQSVLIEMIENDVFTKIQHHFIV